MTINSFNAKNGLSVGTGSISVIDNSGNASFGNVGVTGSLEPGVTNLYNLGSPTKVWNNVYANSISGSLAGNNLSAGQVVFAGTNGVLSGSNNLYWNNSLATLGIGTNTPGSTLSVNGTSELSGTVLPGSNLTYDLGSSTKKWRDLYARSGSFDGDVTVSGNFTVAGTQTIVNSTTVNIGDNIVLLNSTASPQQYGGIYVADTTVNTTGSLLWDSNTDRWVAGLRGSEIGLVSGSGASNYVTKWSGSNGVTSGSIYDDGTNVGIGTTSPSTFASTRSLVIGQSVVTEQNAIKIFGGVNADKAPVISLFRAGNTEGIISQLTGSNALALGSGGGIASFTDAALTAYSALFIRNTGNVSIGAAIPAATSKFYVSGSSTASTATAIIREGVASPTGGVGVLNVQNSAGTSLLFVSGSGNVGIGNSTPNEKLSVNGSMSVTGSALPGTDLTYDLGSTSKRWANIYAGNISGSLTGSGLAAGSVVFTYDGGILSGSNSQFYWDYTNNRLGIGTTSPSFSLQLGNNTAASTTSPQTISLGGTYSSAAGSNLKLRVWTDGTLVHGFGASANQFDYAASTGASHVWYIAGNEYMRLNTTGVGLGTNNPGFRLQLGNNTVSSTATPETISLGGTYSNSAGSNLKLRIWTDGSLVQGFGASANQLDYSASTGTSHVWYTAGAEKLRIDSTGSLGLGTSTPTVRFHVSGSSTASQGTAIIREGVASPTGGVGTLDVQNSVGTSLLFVSGSGNVGIGTTSPADSSGWSGKLLDIRGNTDSNGAVVYFSALSGANYRAYVGSVPTYGLILGSKTALPVTMWTNDLERIRVTSTGNVGIGTTAPTAQLFVSGSSTASTATAIIKEGVASPTGGVGVLNVQNSAGTSLLFVSGSGNVGVGNSTPTSKLHVYSTGSTDSIVQSTTTNASLTLAGKNIAQATTITGSIDCGTADGMTIKTSTNSPIIFSTNSTQAMQIDTSQNVIVGTSLGGLSRLTVSGSSSNSDTVAIIKSGVSNYSNGAGILDVRSSTGSSYLFVSGSGKVGIGTSSPSSNLHVSSTGNTFSTVQSTTTNVDFVLAGVSVSTPVTGVIEVGGANANMAIATTTSHPIALLTNSTEAMRIDTSQRVGIGTTSPTTKLFVSGSSTASETTALIKGGVAVISSGAGILDVQNSSGTSIFFVTGSNQVAIGTTSPGSRLHISGSSITTEKGLIIKNGTTTTSTLALDVQSNTGTSNFYVNYAGQVTANSTFYTSDLLPQTNNTYNVGGLAAYAAVYSYSYPAVSDYRIKKNITEITGSLEKVSKLRPSSYEFNADIIENVENLGPRVGFIAHEMQEIYPNLVKGEKDAVDENGKMVIQEITQDDLIPYLVDSIRELKTLVDDLKEQNSSLRDRIETLEQQVKTQ